MEVVGETVNVCPLQMVAVPAAMEGVGFNVMDTLKGIPGHDPEVGVTL